MLKIKHSYFHKPFAPRTCPQCGLPNLDSEQLVNFEDSSLGPWLLNHFTGGFTAARYQCGKCRYAFVTPAQVLQVLLRFADQFGDFPTVLEAPPDYLYTLTHSSLGREEVGRIDQVTDLRTGEPLEVSATLGLGKASFVHASAPQSDPNSLMKRMESGLELTVEPKPPSVPLRARDEWGIYEWSQDSRRWTQLRRA